MRAKKMYLMMLASVVMCGVSFGADSGDAKTAGKGDVGDLAKKSQNPISDLISVQFQNNTYFETGPMGRTQNVLLFQPVIPMELNEDWNFITRPILPVINQPAFTDTQNRNGGIGNLQLQTYFSPKEKVCDWIVGFGPNFEFPTNSGPDGQFGPDNWSAGPAAVALQIKGHWVYGGLLSHLWSYHGNDGEVNRTTFQPFINYNMKDGWYLATSPVLTYNWAAESRQKWTIPIGGGIGRVFKVGKQPINAALRAYHNLESPRAGSDWQLQLQVTFLFPK
jgi:hypothetical protein